MNDPVGLLSVEHPTLHAGVTDLLGRLRDWAQQVRPCPGGSFWTHHGEFAQRTEHLADHLTALLALASEGLHPSAMAVARTALEHHVLDRLLLLTDRYAATVISDDPAQVERWAAEWEARTEGWTKGTVSFQRTKSGKGFNFVRLGYPIRHPGTGEVVEHVSPYRAALEHYNAFIGHPLAQAGTLPPFADLAQREATAKQHQQTYSRLLTWQSMRDNLRLSNLADEQQLIQLGAHYTFLSAFAHATPSGYTLSATLTAGGPEAAHLFRELALLYAGTLGVAQVDTWVRYIEQRPTLLDPLNTELRATVERVRELVGYLWFLVGEPQAFDRYQEANRRGAPEALAGGRPTFGPDDIPVEEIGYYSNPIERLGQLHVDGYELVTGFSHRAMWPRHPW